MAPNENPWSPWVSQHVSGTFAHPDAPEGGIGYGFSREVGPSGTDVYGGGTPDPHSPEGRDISPQQAAAHYALYEVERAVEQLSDARSAEDLLRVIEAAFGSKSFSEGLCRGQRSSPEGQRFLELQKRFVLAELYDRLSGRAQWPLSGTGSFGFRGPALWQVGHWLPWAGYKATVCADRLKKPAEARDGWLKELTALFAQGDGALAAIKAQLKPEALEMWAKYSKHAQSTTESSRREAGAALGAVIIDVLSVIATLSKTAGSAAKLRGVVPQLLDLAVNLSSGRAGGAADEGAAANGGAKTTPTPKAPVATTKAPTTPNPARSVLAPTTAERTLAAQENAQPDDGLNAERFSAREKVVRDFYEGRPGLNQARADQDMGVDPVTTVPNANPKGYGIDLNGPVKVVDLPPPEQINQFVKSHGFPGNFFDPLGNQSGDSLGLNADPGARASKTFNVSPAKQRGLVSRNGPIVDDWTDPANPTPTRGGGTQLTVDDAFKKSLTPQPQPW